MPGTTLVSYRQYLTYSSTVQQGRHYHLFSDMRKKRLVGSGQQVAAELGFVMRGLMPKAGLRTVTVVGPLTPGQQLQPLTELLRGPKLHPCSPGRCSRDFLDPTCCCSWTKPEAASVSSHTCPQRGTCMDAYRMHEDPGLVWHGSWNSEQAWGLLHCEFRNLSTGPQSEDTGKKAG